MFRYYFPFSVSTLGRSIGPAKQYPIPGGVGSFSTSRKNGRDNIGTYLALASVSPNNQLGIA